MPKRSHIEETRSRRRGSSLESALLEAAWNELVAVGYSKLTMDGVAFRAQTSKPVIYRRWQNRVALMLAVLRHRSPMVPERIADTGNLRSDVLSVMRGVAMTLSELSQESVWAIIADCFIDRGDARIAEAGMKASVGTMALIIQRAVNRGELPESTFPRRVVSLPLDLSRHEMLIRRAPVPEEILIEIVDKVFLPLLRVASVKEATSEGTTESDTMIRFVRDSTAHRPKRLVRSKSNQRTETSRRS
jgi:AcrR family transcriptional regulator